MMTNARGAAEDRRRPTARFGRSGGIFVAAILIGAAASMPRPSNGQEFGYACPTCPSNWGRISQEFRLCETGEQQSPIDIASVRRRPLPPLRFDYGVTDLEVERPNRTNAEAKVESGGLEVGERSFHLVQFHFHSLSEHFLFGEQAPLEIHLVHRGADGSLLVLSRFIVTGDALNELDPVIDVLPSLDDVGDRHTVGGFDLHVLLPRSTSSYRYTGSTTTPGCVEDVQWIVMRQPLPLSAEQIGAIQAALRNYNSGFDNNRPIQSRNGRVVLTDVPRYGFRFR